MFKNNIKNACLVIIGNEILTGRTQDKNINHIAKELFKVGILLSYVCVIPDFKNIIIKQILEGKSKEELMSKIKKEFQKLLEEIKENSNIQIITKYKGLDPKRAKTIQAGILLAKEIISKYNVNSIKVSNSDILEGLILKKY